jgi:signal transduction histidine kinase
LENNIHHQSFQVLREKAKMILQANSMKRRDTDAAPGGSPDEDDIYRLIHEIEIQQVELELQNEELREAKTALEESQRKYYDLYQFAPIAYVSVTPKGVIEELNDAAARLLNGSSTYFVSRSFSSFIHTADQGAYFEFLKNKAMHRADQPCTLRLAGIEGRLRSVQFHAKVQKNKAEHISKWNYAMVDITDLVESRESLSRLNETLERRVAEGVSLAELRSRQLRVLAVELLEAEEKERRRIATLLHDDLQQMLAATRMQVEVASLNNPEESLLTTSMQILSEAIEKTRGLSHELTPPALHLSSLMEAFKSLAESMKQQFALNVAVTGDFFESLDDTTLKPFLYRAVQELLFNSRKHGKTECAQVHLSSEPGYIVVRITDQGVGFDSERLKQMETPPGLGLLSIQERAAHIGGSLVIESKPGQGCRITLKIPQRLPGKNEEIQPAFATQAMAFNISTPHGMGCTRVLLVDDHKVMRQGLRQLLDGRADLYVVGEAENGYEAIEKTRSLKPDVVIMDVSMPQMDGIEATRLIKLEMPEVRVISLTMHEDDQVLNALRKAGADGVVSKAAGTVELLKVAFGINGNGK